MADGIYARQLDEPEVDSSALSQDDRIRELQERLRQLQAATPEAATPEAATPEAATPEVATPEVATPEKYSQTEAALRSAGQMATFGGADEMIAGGQSLYDEYVEDKDDTYDERLLEQRRRDYGSAKEWPKTDMAAGLATAGVMSAIPIPGVRAAAAPRAAMQAAKVAKYIKDLSRTKKTLGAGAATGYGKSEKKITEDPLGVATDIGKGAGYALVGEKVIKGAAKSGGRMFDSAKEVADSRMVKAVYGHAKGNLLRMAKIKRGKGAEYKDFKKAIDRVGTDLREERLPNGEKMIHWSDNLEEISLKLGEAKRRYGEKIGQIGDGLDALLPKGAVTVSSIVKGFSGLEKELKGYTTSSVNIKKTIADNIERLKELHPSGRMTFAEAQALKAEFKWEAVDKEIRPLAQAYSNKQNQVISKAMGDVVEGMAGNRKKIVSFFSEVEGATKKQIKEWADDAQDKLKNWSTIKAKYGTFKDASNASTDRRIGDTANRIASPSDYAVGLTGGSAGIYNHLTQGDPTVTAMLLASGFFHKMARERGNVVVSRTADFIAGIGMKHPHIVEKIYKPLLKKVGQKSFPMAMMATHKMMLKDPDYGKYFDEQYEDMEYEKGLEEE